MRALGTLVALLLLGSQALSEPEWTYSEGGLEEQSWPLEYPACGGHRQSPINLQRKKVQYNPSLQVLELKGYDTPTGEFSMINNGHTGKARHQYIPDHLILPRKFHDSNSTFRTVNYFESALGTVVKSASRFICFHVAVQSMALQSSHVPGLDTLLVTSGAQPVPESMIFPALLSNGLTWFPKEGSELLWNRHPLSESRKFSRWMWGCGYFGLAFSEAPGQAPNRGPLLPVWTCPRQNGDGQSPGSCVLGKVQVSLPPTMRMTTSDGTEYIALQMHYHWGGASSEVSGSEHTVDGIRRVIEVHVVHYNSKYESYDVAKDASDGLAVLAAFIEINDYAENTYYSQLISQLANIRYPGQVTTLRDLNIREMLPENVDHYYTYQGSLTTPPCSENVLWFVLANSAFLSRAQVWKMENSLLNHLNETLQNGYRSTQPLNQRVVEANFLHYPTQSYVSLPEFQSHLSSINRKLEFLRRSIIPKKFKRKSDNLLAGSMSW